MSTFVIGVVLRIEVIGWTGDAPGLPQPPVRVEDAGRGVTRFYYDYSPKDPDLDVPQMCSRLSSRLARALLSETSPFVEKAVAARTVLEFGVAVPAGAERYSYSWPVEFLQTLADAEIELAVSHYATTEEATGESGLIIED